MLRCPLSMTLDTRGSTSRVPAPVCRPLPRLHERPEGDRCRPREGLARPQVVVAGEEERRREEESVDSEEQQLARCRYPDVVSIDACRGRRLQERWHLDRSSSPMM